MYLITSNGGKNQTVWPYVIYQVKKKSTGNLILTSLIQSNGVAVN